MSLAPKPKERPQPGTLVSLLNELLANTIAFKLSTKQAHWNVKGENFITLHELFDKVSSEVDGYADMLAERAVQIGGVAQGTLQTISNQCSLPDYPVDIRDGQSHIKELTGAISVLADAHRQAINIATDSGDMVTADLFTEVTRGLDKIHWVIRSHLNS